MKTEPENDMENDASENITEETQSTFDSFTSFVVRFVSLCIKIFNVYLVCSWCQTTFAAIMAAIAMVIGCSFIHIKILDFLTGDEVSKINKQLITSMMLNGNADEYFDKLKSISRKYEWAIILFQGFLTCILKFAIG
jgi:hypothetical protein